MRNMDNNFASYFLTTTLLLLFPFIVNAQPDILLSNNLVNTGKCLTLKWGDEDKPCLYDVYLDTNPSPTTLIASNLKENKITVTVDQPNQKYYYKIVVNKDGNKLYETSIHNFTPWANACPLSFSMINVDGGEFLMGNENYRIYPEFETWGKLNSSSSTPIRNIFLDDYSIAKYEVTYSQFLTFLNSIKDTWTVDEANGKIMFKTGERAYYNGILYEKSPVELCNVTGIDKTFDFIADSKLLWDAASSTLSIKAGYEQYPANWISQKAIIMFADWAGQRLPTEAEWEYAAKGGQHTQNCEYPGSNNPDEVAWYIFGDVNMNNPMSGTNNGVTQRNNKGTNKVGLKKANELGIYDMAGNVSELCFDYFNGLQYHVDEPVNPQGPLSGNIHSARGGSWNGIQIWIMSTGREWSTANFTLGETGIRLAGNHSISPTVLINGIIKDQFGGIPSGVEINCNNASASLQSNGRYQVRMKKGEACVIKPYHPNYEFSPSEIRIENPQQVISNINFIAYVKKECKISGAISKSDNSPYLYININGFPTGIVASDLNTGEYSTYVPANTKISLSIFQKDYKPIDTTITVGITDIENLDFVLDPWQWYSVSGTAPKGTKILGLPVKTVATSGQYQCNLPQGWSGTLTTKNISSTGKINQFSPKEYEVVNLNEYLEVNFSAGSIYTGHISGHITDPDGNPVSGIEISGVPTNVISNKKGEFWIETSTSFAGTLTPKSPDYTFSPASLSPVFGSDVYIEANFVATPVFEHTIDITVADENGLPVQGVKLTGFENTVQTDLNGTYHQFIDKAQTYSITPLHDNYTFTPSVLSLSNISGDISKTIVATINTSELVFTVQDTDGAAITGASLNFDGDTHQTNASGNITIHNPANGLFKYTVTANNYQTVQSTIVVYQGKVEKTVIMKKMPTVHFIVKDSNGSISNAEITIDGFTYTTDASGEVSIFPVSNGTYSYTVTANGYQGQTGSITVDGTDITEPVTLIENPYFTLTVRTSLSPVPNATVTLLTNPFAGNTYTTNSQGKVEIRENFTSGGRYYFEVSYPGLQTYTGSFRIYSSPVSKTVTLTHETYSLTFNFTDGTNPVNSAKLTFNGQTYTTNSGTVSLTSIFKGTYNYIAGAQGYKTVTGTISLTSDIVKEIILQKSNALNFEISDINGDPLSGVSVWFENTSNLAGITDTNGKLSISEVTDGTYDYYIYIDGYEFIADQVTIAGNDETLQLILDYLKITFKVTDVSGNPLAHAKVNIFGQDNYSDVNGEVLAADPKYGNYSYTISCPNYKDYADVITINSNVTIPVTMERSNSTNYTVTFFDWDGTFLKQESVNSGASATAPAASPRTGYTFTGWDTDYSNVTSNLTVTAQYSINTFTVTFKDWNNTTLKTETVDYGNAATAPSDPTRTGYAFTGWDVVFSNIISDLTVTAIYQPVTSITEQASESIHVYPNPTTDVLYINPGITADVSIISVTGHEIYRDHSVQPGQAINVGHLEPGIYFIKINKTICKIIKQ